MEVKGSEEMTPITELELSSDGNEEEQSHPLDRCWLIYRVFDLQLSLNCLVAFP